MSPKRFSKEQADKLAAELNESHREFVHVAVDTESQEIAQSLIELKEKIFGVAQPIDYSAFAATHAIGEEESFEEEPALQS